jgi:hypothetical protein
VTSDEALEIKTTRGEVRRHRFALAQLRPSGGRRVWVVSILAVPSASGETVPDVVNRIVPRLSGRGDLQLKLETQAAKWLGSAWRPAEQTPLRPRGVDCQRLCLPGRRLAGDRSPHTCRHKQGGVRGGPHGRARITTTGTGQPRRVGSMKAIALGQCEHLNNAEGAKPFNSGVTHNCDRSPLDNYVCP